MEGCHFDVCPCLLQDAGEGASSRAEASSVQSVPADKPSTGPLVFVDSGQFAPPDEDVLLLDARSLKVCCCMN